MVWFSGGSLARQTIQASTFTSASTSGMSYSRPSSSRLIEEVLDAADQLDDSSDSHPGGLAPTSRTSVTKVVSIVSSFNEYKRFLVNEIGWGGILKLPALARLNLRFSKWWMSRLDGPSMSVHLNATKRLRFWPGDVHKVFGVPCGPKNILGPDGQCSETTIQFLRSVLGMPKKGNQVLKAAESNLTRPLSEHCSSNLEKDCFKMAFVIFVIGHLLAPSNKHDTSIIDYWGEIANTDRIADFDWCNYVLSDLISASQQVQSDMRNNKLKTHLQGCHVFLQIRSPHDNCYTRSTFDLAAENLSRTMPQRNQSPTPTLRPTIPTSTSLSLKTPRTPTTPAVPHTTVHNFANYMKSNYPHISSPPMSTTHQNLALSGRKLDMSDSEANSVTPPSFATTSNKPSTLQLAKTWADTIACGVLMFNDDQNIPDGAVTFAQLSDQLPTKSASRHLKYATDHWTARAYQPKLSIDSLASVEQFMNKLSEDVARRHVFLLARIYGKYAPYKTNSLANERQLIYRIVKWDESDLAMIQMACSFNGVGVSEMLNKVNVRIQKINLVADVAKLIHNAGEPPVELHAIVS
ncbi:unnamed protein product [Triticum turgidum subsp. durum]|uniref:Uncharacterized protein n=1 Tax=Triticum turgidum subsp. durum TaxID=4567 RepID=A0A9R0Q4A1_TRITD|nr:unnamed protein product [Triticum turgidum subsp. durum]